MYIHEHPGLKTCYRLVITILAIIGVGIECLTLGVTAWRIFPTYALLLLACYFLVSSIKTAFYLESGESQIFCPTWQGAAIVAGLILLVGQTVALANGVSLPGLKDGGIFLIAYLLPILALLDWLIFSPKGNWQPGDPFYWLAGPVIYAAWILITAEFLPQKTELLYPYEFLDQNLIGLDGVAWSITIIVVLILAAGYVLLTLDFLMSGRARQYLVLPKIKTIVVEEEFDFPDEVIEDSAEDEVIREAEVVEDEVETEARADESRPSQQKAAESKTDSTDTENASETRATGQSNSARAKVRVVGLKNPQGSVEAERSTSAEKAGKAGTGAESQKPAEATTKQPKSKSAQRAKRAHLDLQQTPEQSKIKQATATGHSRQDSKRQPDRNMDGAQSTSVADPEEAKDQKGNSNQATNRASRTAKSTTKVRVISSDTKEDE